MKVKVEPEVKSELKVEIEQKVKVEPNVEESPPNVKCKWNQEGRLGRER